MKKHFVFLLFCLLAQFFFQVPCAYAQAIALTESKVTWRSWHLTNKRGANFLVKVSGNTLEATDNTINDASTFVMDAGPDDANWTTPDSRWFFIRSLSTGLYITVAESGDLPRSVFLSAYDENSHAQQFRLVDGGVPNYKLRSRLSASGPDLVLETDDDGRLQATAPVAVLPRQNFTFSLAMPSGSGRRYTLVNSVKARYISDNGIKSEGTHAVQNKDVDESAIWHLDHVDGDWYRIRNNLTQQFLTAPEGADPFTYVDMTAGTYGNRSQWKLERNNATFLVSNREFPDLFLSINIQSPGEPLLLMGADDLDRRLWVISLMPEEVEVQTGDYDRIETGPLSNDCFYGYGPNFKKGLCERVGLNPEHSELYFEFIQDAIAAKMGANRVDEILQKFALGNAGHRVDLVIMVRQYLTEELTTLPYDQWSPAAQAVVTEWQNKVQALRLDYASRLNAAWTAYVAEHGNNIGFADLYFFWIDGDGFVWPAYYNANETQALLIRDYASGAATFGERNAAIVGNTALGAAVGISMVYSVTALTPSVYFIGQQIFLAGIGQAAFPFCAIVSTSALPVTVAVVAATSLAFQIMEVIEFQDFQNDLQDELIWAQQGINIPAILVSNSLLDRVRLLADLDYLLGAPTTGSFQYNDNDNAYLPPFTLNCPPTLTVNLDANGMATLTPDQLTGNALTSPVCGGEIGFNLSKSQFDCGDLGNHTVTLTAQNTKKTDQCNTLVTVRDATAPTMVCPENQTRNTDPNQCSATMDYTVTAADNCSYTLTRTGGLASGSSFPTGTTNVAWKAADTGGNSTLCAFTVTVSDNQKPSVVCPGNISKNTDPNQCSAVVTYASPSFSDNCSAALALTSPAGTASGSAFPKGTTMVGWKATDVAGNSSVCGFTVTVTDAQAPSITCPSNLVRSTDAGQCSAVVTYTSPTYSDNCTGAGLDHISGGLSNTAFPKGCTSVIWQAADAAGLTKRCTFTVTVNDNQVPAITCPSNQTKSADAGLCTAVVNYTMPTATDNCPGVGVAIHSGPASGQPFPKGQTTVVLKATDAVGLTKTCTFRITVNDTQAPTISCPSGQSLNTDANLCSAVATYATPTASDNCTPPPTVLKTSGLASGSAFPKGSNTVVWKATDGAGLTKTCSFTVTVTDAQLPTIACPANLSVTGSGNPCTATVIYATPTATDNCTVQSVFLLSGMGSGSQFPAGVTNVVWQAVDNSGGSATCAFSVTVGCGTENEQSAVRSEQLRALATDTGQPITMNLAPNPATTEVWVSVEGLGEGTGRLTVFDPAGRMIWQQQAASGQTKVDFDSRWPSGVYLVVLRTGDLVVTKRLVVSKL